MAPAALTRSELFDRLAAGHAAGTTVVTPNRRLAQLLRAEFDAFQEGGKLPVWEDADILPFDAFVARCYEEALYTDAGARLPLLLSEAQSRALWEEAIRASRWNGALLDAPRTAASAQDAWRRAQAWRIAGDLDKFAATEDTQAFAAWAREYLKRCRREGFVDPALLPDMEFSGRTPRLLVAYAFDILPPQTKDFLERFSWAVCSPETKNPVPRMISFASPREELEAAARWARARLEAGARRIGVVLPDLQLRRREVTRVFARTVRPDFNLPGAAGATLPFELSGGEPLAGYPLVAFALALVEFSVREMPFEDVSRLIRSPFLTGADGERAVRAELDARLRRSVDAEISLARLIGLVDGCPVLRQRLERIFELKAETRSPGDWAQHVTALLDAAGFPGDRAPDSAEYQTRAKFNEVLGEFARLTLVSEKMTAMDALGALRRLCTDAEFQPERVGGIGAPIQVLGMLESAGAGFDALWVSGLTDEQWPQRLRPDPFLPVALQRKAGIPEASAEASLSLDRRRTEGWLHAADEVVFSWARREEDRELSASPLIAQLPEGEIDLPLFDSFRELIFSSRALESVEDGKAPSIKSKAVRGGTRVLADQAACPFRAFARHRLGAAALEAPEPGPDAMARGQLLHRLMAGIWSELKTKENLAKDISLVVARAAENAVKQQQIEGKFGELEKRRLIRLAGEWLEIERTREDFSVEAVESKIEISIANISLTARIDRMDRLADGTRAIIDYKTGSRATPNDWMGERPDEPQLPLYAVAASGNVAAVAFAKLKTGEMKFAGFAAQEKAIPGVRAAKSWPGLMQYWKTELEKLAGGYAQGEARVDPKKGLATCRKCDLQPLCRVYERLSALDDSAFAGDDS